MNNPVLYLIYDGECPMCRNVAKLLKIRQCVGQFTILNARENHLLVEEVKSKGYDLNNGIIVHYRDQFYFGKDAVQLLAMVGSPIGLLNKINIIIFKSKFLTAVFYSVFKTIIGCLLFLLGIKKINGDSSDPIFKTIFGNSWESLPLPLKKHYANRAYSRDEVRIEGRMDIEL